MKLVYSPAEWNPLWLNHLRENQKIGFVPTMGALHEGHLDLVRKALETADVTVVSIFVNPTQFNNSTDFEKYPNTLSQDIALLEKYGVDYLFIPDTKTMYQELPKLKIDFGDLEHVLEGKCRPGHFNGVGIVVAKLFNMIRPSIAFFGQKDLQQVAVIKRLVYDLNFPVELITVPTKRELDGLAMSSRNLRLSPTERKQALILINCLRFAKNELLSGKSWRTVKSIVAQKFQDAEGTTLEYFELIQPNTFEIYDEFDSNLTSSICVAAFVGEIRLIDNLPIIG